MTIPTIPTRRKPEGNMESLEERAPPTSTSRPAGAKAKPHRGSSAPGEQAPGSLIHPARFSPVTMGFWLGGAGLGTGGCLLGALIAYRHPVAVALSVLWWGLYFGCFGASVGALVGVLTDRAPPRPPATGDGAGKVATELGLDSRVAHTGSRAVRATQVADGKRAR
jgi:hypothetical protein